MRTEAPIGTSGHPECAFCGCIFKHITTCKHCQWQQGIACINPPLWHYICDGCNNDMCSRLFRLMEEEEVERSGGYIRGSY